MLSRNFGVQESPLIQSPYVQTYQTGVVAPGNVEFIATENLYTITTESGVGLVTEGLAT